MAVDILVCFVFICIFSAAVSFSMGANDESVGTVFGSRALSLRNALILGGAMEFAGSVLFGTEVATTVADKLFSVSSFNADEVDVLMAVVLTSLIGSSAFMCISSYFGLPVSSTHSIIGALACAAALAKGPGVLNGEQFAYIAASWVLSPLLGGVCVVLLCLLTDAVILRDPTKAFRSCCRSEIEEETMYRRAKLAMPFVAFVSLFVSTLFVVLKGIPVTTIPLSSLTLAVLGAAAGVSILLGIFAVPRLDRMISAEFESVMSSLSSSKPSSTMNSWRRHAPMWKTQRLFAYLQIITASLFAFARGSNDSSHGAGPFALGLKLYQDGADALTSSQSEVPLWTLAVGGAFMCVGLWTLGRNVVKAIGDNITSISPVRGVAIETATAVTVLVFSNFGIPISSTHTLVGAIFFMGLARRHGWINALAAPPQLRIGAQAREKKKKKEKEKQRQMEKEHEHKRQLDDADSEAAAQKVSSSANGSHAASAAGPSTEMTSVVTAADKRPPELGKIAAGSSSSTLNLGSALEVTSHDLSAPDSPVSLATDADHHHHHRHHHSIGDRSHHHHHHYHNDDDAALDLTARMARSRSASDPDIVEPLQVSADTAPSSSAAAASNGNVWRVVAIPSFADLNDGTDSNCSGSPRLGSGSASDDEAAYAIGEVAGSAIKTVVVTAGAGDTRKPDTVLPPLHSVDSDSNLLSRAVELNIKMEEASSAGSASPAAAAAGDAAGGKSAGGEADQTAGAVGPRDSEHSHDDNKKVHWRNLLKIAASWVLTIPLSGLLTCVLLALIVKT